MIIELEESFLIIKAHTLGGVVICGKFVKKAKRKVGSTISYHGDWGM